MLRLIPTRDDRVAADHLARLLRRPDPTRFACGLRSLHRRYRTYAATCPVPLAAAGLTVSPEIRVQCELYLPLGEIRELFHQLYRHSLTYPPILTSTPFHGSSSWADLYAALPAEFQVSPNPARLLERLLEDNALLRRFLFYSFLPGRFYGGFSRYPGQRAFIQEWLKRPAVPLRCLDAACGTGEESYALARMLLEMGCSPASFRIDGWTVEPLEVWGAASGIFPHHPVRTAAFRAETAFLFMAGAESSLEFRSVDLLASTAVAEGGRFDLILCNGLLGGPILHERHQLERLAAGLAGMLTSGGMLLAADSFHGGWKRKHPQEELRVLLEAAGLVTGEAGEGLAGTKPAG